MPTPLTRFDRALLRFRVSSRGAPCHLGRAASRMFGDDRVGIDTRCVRKPTLRFRDVQLTSSKIAWFHTCTRIYANIYKSVSLFLPSYKTNPRRSAMRKFIEFSHNLQWPHGITSECTAAISMKKEKNVYKIFQDQYLALTLFSYRPSNETSRR